MPTEPAAAWLLNGDETYGVAGPVLTLAEGLAQRGWRTLIITLGDGPFAEKLRQRHIETESIGIDLPLPFLTRNPARMLSRFGKLFGAEREASERIARLLASHRADHLGVRWPNHVRVGGLAARAAGAPCYWMMPNAVSDRWPLGINRRAYQRTCARLDVRPLPNSRYTGRTLGPGLDDRVLYLGVDANRFDPRGVESVSRQELGVPEGASVLGVFARMDPDKGQLRVVEAAAACVADGEDLHVVLLGGPTDTPYADRVQAHAQSGPMRGRVHLAGWSAEPERYYAMIDLPINARLEPEPFGLSVVEAMLMERPPLVHASGGPAETVVDGNTGWLIRGAQAADLAAGVRRALADRNRWPSMRTAAREHALERFSTDAFVDAYVRLTSD